MDVAASSVSRSQAQVKYEASVKVASMSQDQMEQTGRNLMKLLNSTEVKQSSHPYKGQNIDFLV